MTTIQSEWLTVADACAYLHVTRATLYRWARQGRVRLFKLGVRTTRVKRSDLDLLVTSEDRADGWTKLSEASFAQDWDNKKDAVYDDWRAIYGVRER